MVARERERRTLGLGICVAWLGLACLAWSATATVEAAEERSAQEQFRQANDAARSGDFPRAIEGYRSLDEAGRASASLYWNWAQAARARAATGEAVWALLRAQELDPGDAAVVRALDRAREELNLSAAELSPEGLAVLRRFARRWRLDWIGSTLLALSVLCHAGARLQGGRGWVRGSWTALVLGLLVLAAPLGGAGARDVGVVLRRDAPLFDSASPSAELLGTLREGEVVPILGRTGPYVRLQDSSGARGWASASDVGLVEARD